MTFLPVLLWSDVLIWLLVLAAIALGALVIAQSPAARCLAAGRAQPYRAWPQRRCWSPSLC